MTDCSEKIGVFTERELVIYHMLYMKEEGRYKFFEMARKLLCKDYKTEGRLLLLYGWNSAWLAKRSGEFKLDRFVETFEKCKPYFDKLQGESLQTIVLEDHEEDIKHIYDTLSSVEDIKSTGASKLMSLENPELFVMWDRGIRKEIYCIKGEATGENYFRFLEVVKEKAKNVVWIPQKCDNITLAKAIDEFNYMKFQETRKRAKAKSEQAQGKKE